MQISLWPSEFIYALFSHPLSHSDFAVPFICRCVPVSQSLTWPLLEQSSSDVHVTLSFTIFSPLLNWFFSKGFPGHCTHRFWFSRSLSFFFFSLSITHQHLTYYISYFSWPLLVIYCRYKLLKSLSSLLVIHFVLCCISSIIEHYLAQGRQSVSMFEWMNKLLLTNFAFFFP